MDFNHIVYLAIGWFIFTSILFIITILFIKFTEIRNSRNDLMMKLSLYYSSTFSKIRSIFQRHKHMFISLDNLSNTSVDSLVNHLNEFDKELNSCNTELSDVINEYCVDNRFLFVMDENLREKIVILNKEIISIFTEWSTDFMEVTKLVNEYNIRKLLEFNNEFESETVNSISSIEDINLDIQSRLNNNYNRYLKMIELVIEVKAIFTNDTCKKLYN